MGFPAAAALACAAFALFYAGFRWCQPWIVAARTNRTEADFMPWARESAGQQDGWEVPVALIGMLGCIGACFEITRRGLGLRVLSSRLVRWMCYAAAAAVTLGIRSSEFSADDRSSWLLVAVATVLLAGAWLVPGASSRRWLRIVAAGFLAATVVTVLLLSAGEPSIWSYGYFIGPALEWMQGERLGSFYMQYSLLGTLVTAAFLRLGLHVNGMELALTALTIGWFALYWWLARECIRDRVLRGLFLVCLFGFRILWMEGHIAAIPQVSPLRMELWVPLALVARKKGFLSPWTAGCFAGVYALDALFGFLYVTVYLACVGFALKDAARSGQVSVSTVLAILVPVGMAAIFNLTLFGSLVSGSAAQYMDLRLGFLPISPQSLFWAVLLILLFSVVVFARAGTERGFGMFLVLIATAQMIYFLGRSHDHNLVNIGGTWLFVAFVALDATLLRTPVFVKSAASVLTIGVFGLGSQRIVAKVEHAFQRLLQGPWYRENDLDRFLDRTRDAWPTNAPNVIVLGAGDAYLNYRLGLRQHGYYSPVYANVLIEETTAWLHGAMAEGSRVIVPKGGGTDLLAVHATVGDMNRTRFMSEHPPGFGVNDSVSSVYYEITLLR